LPQLPEGVEGSNAIAMAEDLHATLVAAQMQAAHQNVVESTETDEWGTANSEGQGCRASRHTLDPLVGASGSPKES